MGEQPEDSVSMRNENTRDRSQRRTFFSFDGTIEVDLKEKQKIPFENQSHQKRRTQ